MKDEAFVIGFTIGNDPQTNWLHLLIFKLFSRWLYPLDCRFNETHLKVFDLGVDYGKKIRIKNLNRVDFREIEHQKVKELRQDFGIQLKELKKIRKIEADLLKS